MTNMVKLRLLSLTMLPLLLSAQTKLVKPIAVLRVTTLAAAGPGSLRQALDAPGPRLIVFEVGGVIDLGGDSVSFMRRHHAHIPYLHLKSVDRDIIRRVEAEHLSTVTAVGLGVFCSTSTAVIIMPLVQ